MPQLITRDHNEITDLSWIETIWQQPVQRLFWLYNVPHHCLRGNHRHQKCRMVLHCVVGSVDVYVQTPEGDCRYTLSSNNEYLFLEAEDWRLMHQFSVNAMLVVFADRSFRSTIYFDQPYRPVTVVERSA
jgi:hypothetical protein